jgi:hypothetical protein
MMSLRFMSDPPLPEPPSLAARAERILNQAATPQQQPPANREERPMTAYRRRQDQAELRIAQLKHDGIEQITDRNALKTMTPGQIAQARREGRLTGMLAGLYDESGNRRTDS